MLAVYGLQVAMGWWPEGHVYREYHTHIDWRWIFMELATLATGAAILSRRVFAVFGGLGRRDI